VILQKTTITNPEKQYILLKGLLEKTSTIKDELKRVSYKVVDNGSNVPSVKIDDRVYTPQEISAMILQR
jgi:molecular chaperone DnaK